MRYDPFKSKLPTAVLGAQHPKLFFFKKSVNIPLGIIEKVEIAKKNDFNFDDTSNEKRRGMKIPLKKRLFPKMEKVKIFNAT